MKRILCAGTFDKLHTGHLKYFEEAKKLSSDPYLIVIVARDDNSRKIKGKEVLNNQIVRLQRIRDLDIVDEAVLGFKSDFIKRVVSLKPNVIVIGYDQWVDEKWLVSELNKQKINAKVVRMKKFEKNYL